MEKEKSLAEAGLFLYGMADADASGTVAVWPEWGGMSGPNTGLAGWAEMGVVAGHGLGAKLAWGRTRHGF